METKKKRIRKKTTKKKVVKKKPVKKKRKVVKSSDIKPKDIPPIEQREQEALEFRNLETPRAYQSIGWNRINAIPDHTEKTNSGRVDSIFGSISTMTQVQAKTLASDPHITIMESMVLQMNTRAMNRTKYIRDKDGDVVLDPETKKPLRETIQGDQKTAEYIVNRVGGKPKDRVEHSGPNGEQLEVKTKQIFDVDSMDRKQRKAFRDMLKKSEALPTKNIEIDGEE